MTLVFFIVIKSEIHVGGIQFFDLVQYNVAEYTCVICRNCEKFINYGRKNRAYSM